MTQPGITRDPHYAKRWQLDRRRGIRRTVPVGPAAEHVDQLLAAGLTVRGIAELAGVSASGVSRIAARQYPTVNHRTADALLAVKPQEIHRRTSPEGFVPAAGARRRIRALLAIGWTHQDMHARSGVRTAILLSQAGEWISRRNHDAISDLHEALWATPGPSEKTRGQARARGYLPPMAWDDDTIDDPGATAEIDPAGPGRGNPRIDIDEVLWLLDGGTPIEDVARRLGVTVASIERHAERHNRAHELRKAS